MEQGRGSKIIAVVALCMAVVGLTVGFAAYSNVLTIQSTAEVSGDPNNFRVVFSNNTNALEPLYTGDIAPDLAEKGDNANIKVVKPEGSDDSYGLVVENIHAKFSAPGDSVTYTFNSLNIGKIDAFLDKVTFKTIGETGKEINCVARTGTNQAAVDNCCPSIKIAVTVGDNSTSEVFEGTRSAGKTHKLVRSNGSLGDGEAHHETVSVTISYASDAEVADGIFDVTFGDIELTYDSDPSFSS